MPILSGVGGDFSAINSDGDLVEFSSFAGKVVIIAFGYTNCADICPFTLGYLKRLYGTLSMEEQNNMQVIFVTVDPQYDTPGHLKSFIGHFNKDFIGLSGTQQQIDYIVSLYQAEYNKLSILNVPTQNIRRVTPKLFADEQEAKEDTASLYSHTVTLYLIDKEGYTRSLEYTGTPLVEFTDKIRQLINE
ncbi:MAG: SCO family protein [Methylophagaceae bacterium]